MDSHLRKAILFLILISAVLAVASISTRAHYELLNINAFFLIAACLIFIASVTIWLFSWAYVLKKRIKLNFKKAIAIGIASFYGSLTPIQLGAEALRSLNLKKIYGVSYKESISASMVAKGMKFFVIGLFAAFFLSFYLLNYKAKLSLLLAYGSGFVVIMSACLLFLMPLNKKMGLRISAFFRRFSRIKVFAQLSEFFESYSEFLSEMRLSTLAFVFTLCLFSWLLEVLALYVSFESLALSLPVFSLFVFATLVAVLERNPFLPRGIGLVEIIGYYFLAMPSLLSGLALTSKEIIAALVVYDVVRLIVPTILSVVLSYPLLKMLEGQESRKGS